MFSVNVGALAAAPALAAGQVSTMVTADAAVINLSVTAEMPDAEGKDFVFRITVFTRPSV